MESPQEAVTETEVTPVAIEEPVDDNSQDDEVEQPEEIAEDETQEDEAIEGEEEEEPSVEYVNTDVNGVEYELPKEVAKAVMQEADYTRSKQSLAEEKKALAQEQENFKATQERTTEDFQTEVALHNVQQQLNQYQNVDWNNLEDQYGADEANKHFRQFQLLTQQKNDLSQQVEQRKSFRTQEMQENFSKRLEQTQNFAVENIPNWNTELANSIEDFAIKEIGLDENFIRNNLSPELLKLMHQAYTGNEVQKKARTVKTKPSVKARPVSTIRSKSGDRPTTRKDLSDPNMSMDEYARLRKQGANPTLG